MCKQNSLLESIEVEEGQVEQNVFFNLIKRVGTLGRYQAITFTLLALISFGNGGISFITPYVFFQDPYTCQTLPASGSCFDFVCNLGEQERQKHIPEPTIHSLANKFGDYRCDSDMQTITLMQTIMYGGLLAGIAFLAFFGGVLGKKNLILLNLVVTNIGLVLAVFSVNLVMGGIGLFCCLFGGIVNLQVCYAYVMEIFNEKYRQTIAMTLSAVQSLGALFNALWFFLLQDYAKVLIYYYLIPTILIAIAFAFFVKDVPIYLVTRSTPQKAYKDLKYIASVNHKSNFTLTVEQLRQIQQNYKANLQNEQHNKKGDKLFSIIDLFRYNSLRKTTLIMLVVQCTCTLIYFAPTLMLAQFKFSIYINGVVVSSSQLIAGIISIYIIKYFPRRLLAMVAFCVTFACSAILIFIWDQNSKEITDVSANILVLVLIFVIEFAISSQFNTFTVYITELYPTQVRVISIGFIKTIGAILLLLESYILQLCLTTGFRIMIIFTFLSVFSVVCSYLLPQTIGKNLPDVIEELRNKGTQYKSIHKGEQ